MPRAAALEAEAQAIAARSSDSSITGVLRREIALTLEHIERVRALRESQNLGLVRVECYTNTELMQMEQRTPRYSPDRYPEREKFQRRLMRIGEERRRLDSSTDERMRQLHDRLLTLLNRHAQLEP